jgi:hypothetical protein
VQAAPAASTQLPAPLHTLLPTQLGASCWPEGVLAHVPTLPATLHAWQVPVQAVSQQTPSTQCPLAHWLPTVQATASAARQLPAPLHTLVPVHEGGSCWKAGVARHVPTLPAMLQAWQVPAHALLQHTPSTQLPLAHSFPAPQVTLLVFLAAHDPAEQYLPAAQSASLPQKEKHAPAPLQVKAPQPDLGSRPESTGPHVPSLLCPVSAAVQAWHVPEQAALQQTPSTQRPLKHSLCWLQVAPWLSRHVPAPLHTLLPTQLGESC